MIRTLIIFLPFFTSALWFLSHRVFISRSDTNHTLAALIGFMTLFLFYDCTYADLTAPNNMQVLAVIVAQLATPSLVPLIIIYLRKLRGTSTRHPLQMLWIVAPVSLLTSAILLAVIAGIDNVGIALDQYYKEGWLSLEPYRGTPLYLFFVSSFRVYHVVNYAEIGWLTIYLIIYKIKGHYKFKTLWNYLFKNGEAPTAQVQSFVSAVIFFFLVAKTPIIKDIVNSHSWLVAIFALVVSWMVYLFCHIAMFGSKPTLRGSDLPDGWRYNYGKKNKSEITQRLLDSLLDDAEEDALIHAQEKIGENLHIEEWKAGLEVPGIPSLNQHIFNAVGQSWEEDSLVPKFQKMMMDEQLFLQPSLTLADVAERLGTNKTYVSKLVNNAYNVGFPELINTLRVDYAEQYILANRDAKQTEIAEKCGFLSASSFNNIFKKVTGMTPNIWKASIERSEQQTKK